MIRMAIAGIAGRMGKEVARAAVRDKDIHIAQALVSASSSWHGEALARLTGMQFDELVCTSKISADFDVLIDFSVPSATIEYLNTLPQNATMVICTTGFSRQQEARIEQVAQRLPIIKASNTSLGITVLQQLIKKAASLLPDADVEIVEAHHRRKKDAPSGTAISLAQQIADGQSTSLDDAIYSRKGITGERPRGPIGFSAIRGGDIIGDHKVMFALEHEILEVSHRALDRSLFAHGAIQAAKWLVGKNPGRVYTMKDVVNRTDKPDVR